jgi:carbonic anhydrase
MPQLKSSLVLSFVLSFASLRLAAQAPPFPAAWDVPPSTYLQTLMTGNATYVGGALPYTALGTVRTATARSQQPPVTILSCADSRVPPELIFGRTVGDLFVVRVAGNVAGPFDIASIEYAVANGWTKLIVVLGHEECGAVKAALDVDDPATPSLVALVERIRESFIPLSSWTSPDRVENAIKANARSSAAYLLAHSPVIRKAVLEHRVGIAVAYYHLGSGKVDLLP